MADQPRGAEETPPPDTHFQAAMDRLVEDLYRRRVQAARYRAVVREGDYPEGDYLGPEVTVRPTSRASEKARCLLIHVLGQRVYEEAMFLTHGWTVIQSRRFPRFDYWLNLINPVGFRVCRHGEGLHGFCVANICIQTVTLHEGLYLPAEDAALAMYLLASYQEDRMLEIGNPDRQWY